MGQFDQLENKSVLMDSIFDDLQQYLFDRAEYENAKTAGEVLPVFCIVADRVCISLQR